MTSHNSNAEQEEPTTPDLPTTTTTTDSSESGDVVPEYDDDSQSESGDGVDLYEGLSDDEAMKKWLSTAYERGTKKPMKAPLAAPWGLAISDADVEKLKVGFKSQSMDDKWDLLVEDPDEHGGVSVHIIRNWLQEECYVLHVVVPALKPSTGSDDKGETESASVSAATIHSITWEGDKAGLQCETEQAKKEAVILARGWLGCEFEALPRYDSSTFWDANGYKKLNGAR